MESNEEYYDQQIVEISEACGHTRVVLIFGWETWATRDTTDPDRIAQALNILADGVLKKMMGGKAKPFVEKIISSHLQ